MTFQYRPRLQPSNQYEHLPRLYEPLFIKESPGTHSRASDTPRTSEKSFNRASSRSPPLSHSNSPCDHTGSHFSGNMHGTTDSEDLARNASFPSRSLFRVGQSKTKGQTSTMSPAASSDPHFMRGRKDVSSRTRYPTSYDPTPNPELHILVRQYAPKKAYFMSKRSHSDVRCSIDFADGYGMPWTQLYADCLLPATLKIPCLTEKLGTFLIRVRILEKKDTQTVAGICIVRVATLLDPLMQREFGSDGILVDQIVRSLHRNEKMGTVEVRGLVLSGQGSFAMPEPTGFSLEVQMRCHASTYKELRGTALRVSRTASGLQPINLGQILLGEADREDFVKIRSVAEVLWFGVKCHPHHPIAIRIEWLRQKTGILSRVGDDCNHTLGCLEIGMAELLSLRKGAAFTLKWQKWPGTKRTVRYLRVENVFCQQDLVTAKLTLERELGRRRASQISENFIL